MACFGEGSRTYEQYGLLLPTPEDGTENRSVCLSSASLLLFMKLQGLKS